MARLDSISAEKLAQLHALELYTPQRAVYLAQQGFSTDATGLAACALAAGRRGRQLTRAWKHVAEALASLRDLNEENGPSSARASRKSASPAAPLAELVRLER